VCVKHAPLRGESDHAVGCRSSLNCLRLSSGQPLYRSPESCPVFASLQVLRSHAAPLRKRDSRAAPPRFSLPCARWKTESREQGHQSATFYRLGKALAQLPQHQASPVDSQKGQPAAEAWIAVERQPVFISPASEHRHDALIYSQQSRRQSLQAVNVAGRFSIPFDGVNVQSFSEARSGFLHLG